MTVGKIILGGHEEEEDGVPTLRWRTRPPRKPGRDG